MSKLQTLIHETDTSEIRVESIALPAGITLEYARKGTGSGTPLIFLHGVTDSWRSFQRIFANLPADITAYAISQRGHGNSSRPAAGYRYHDFARDLQSFMETLDLSPAVVVGHSMGAMVAQQFAIEYPSRLAGLVLMGGWGTMKGHPVLQEFVDSSISTLTDPIDPAFVREFQLSTLAREVPAHVIDDAVIESLKVPARVWRATFQGFQTNEPSNGAGRIVTPTLIAWGDRDSYAHRSDQDALLAAIPGARFVIYEGAGHAFHWEDPARFAADLVAFVSEIALAGR